MPVELVGRVGSCEPSLSYTRTFVKSPGETMTDTGTTKTTGLTFEEALAAMRKGKRARYDSWNESLSISIDDDYIYIYEKGQDPKVASHSQGVNTNEILHPNWCIIEPPETEHEARLKWLQGLIDDMSAVKLFGHPRYFGQDSIFDELWQRANGTWKTTADETPDMGMATVPDCGETLPRNGKTTGLTFPEALEAMKQGKRVKVRSWPSYQYVHLGKGRDGNPVFGNNMRAEWLPDARSCLAEDWEIVE